MKKLDLDKKLEKEIGEVKKGIHGRNYINMRMFGEIQNKINEIIDKLNQLEK